MHYLRFWLTDRAAIILNHRKDPDRQRSNGAYISRLIEQDRGLLSLPDELTASEELWEINYRWADTDKTKMARVILPIESDAERIAVDIGEALATRTGCAAITIEGYRHPDRTLVFSRRIEASLMP